jgi:UDP:flavonoid glycosyltransferase YjiC (YdhE family)
MGADVSGKIGSVRVLLSSPGLVGHIHPLMPLAAALRTRGHDVCWATGPDGCDRVERAGFDAVSAGLSQAERWAQFGRRHPEINDLAPHERPDVMFGKLFGETSAPAALADLLPLVRSWRPELVVNDAAEFAAPIAATVIGVPHVTHAFGALLPEERVRRAGDEVAPLWRAEGLEPRPYGGVYDHLYLDIYPPSLQASGGNHLGARQLVRPVAFAGATDEGVRSDITDRTGSPLVYLTFGTFFNDNDAFKAALAGIRDVGVGLVVTVGPDGDPGAFGPQPPRVVVERYIPQTQLLPACDVVASHGGSGTVLAALALGIPELCLPQAADQFLNAAAVARAGAGLVISPEEVDAAGVGDAIRRLLDDSSFRVQARRLAGEIASMPSPEAVVTVLETLA